MPEVNLLTVLLTGLFTGGLTCLAVQGGLLTSSISQHVQDELKNSTVKTHTFFHITAFLVAKIVAYTLVGFLLGLLGSTVQLSLTVRVVLQFAVAFFMLGTAANLLNLHPIFRYFIIQPPKFITRRVRNQAKSKTFFAPAFLGAFTVFIPCGTTQAMMALALSTSNPFLGALVMFVFTLGTSPVFFILGYMTNIAQKAFDARFSKIVATLLIVLAIYTIDGAMALTGKGITIRSIAYSAYCTISWCNDIKTDNILGQIADNPTITIDSGGYSPRVITVKRGSQVKLNILNNSGGGCIQAFTIPEFKIEKIVPIGKSDVVQFTAPDKPGTIRFMCSMGMFDGEIKVV